MAVNLETFERALNSLNAAITAQKNDLSRDAAIQRFKFCVELSWKSAKKLMGTSTSAPKQVIREMAQNGLITDAEYWLLSIDKRNLSAHTYNEDLAEAALSACNSFYYKHLVTWLLLSTIAQSRKTLY